MPKFHSIAMVEARFGHPTRLARATFISSFLAVAAIIAALAGMTSAATRAWNAGDGNWSVPGNWSPAGVPAGGDTANVLNTDGVSRTITYDYTGPAVTLAFLPVDLTGGMPTDTETLSMAANNLTSAFEYVGWSGAGSNGSGTFNQSGGANTINGTARYLGLDPTDNGYYNLSGTGSLIASGNTGEIIGYSGTGYFSQSGGFNVVTESSSALFLGNNAHSSGTYILNSGSLTMAFNGVNAQEYVGYSGIGSFTQTGGSNAFGTDLWLGFNIGSTGTYTQTGGTNIGTGLIVGRSGNGIYNLSGGSLSTSEIIVGGTFNQTGGTNTVVELEIGGIYNLSGGSSSTTSILNGGVLAVGGTGVLTVSGTLSAQPGSSINLSGGQINAAALNFNGTPAPLNWTGGTLNLTSGVTWDSGAAATSTSSVFGPALTLTANQNLMVTGNETVGGAGSFSLEVGMGSTHYVTGTLTVSLTGTITLDAGGTLYAPTITQAGGTVNGTLQNQGVFNYRSGLFNGRLVNQGTVNLAPSFTAGDGIENDTMMTVAAGQNVTANGSGFDNLGSLSLTGGTISGGPMVNEFGATIQGHGAINSAVGNLGTVIVGGPLNFNAGTTNDGLVEGNGNLTGAFSNNADGTVSVAAGNSLSIASDWANAGLIALQGSTARLGGGTITNKSTLQGFGIVNCAVANAGTIEALGGTLSFGGTLTNPAGGMLTTGTGTKLLVTAGLATNAGIINLTGGTFDNNGHPLANTGQISGWGIFRTGGAGLDNHGSITFTGGVTTVNGPVTNEDGKTITLAYNPAIFTGLVTNTGTGTFNVNSTTVTFAGGSSGNVPAFANAAGAAFAKAGSGALEVDGPPSLGSGSSLAVGDTGTLRFKATSGAASIGTGVTAAVASGATLELAGSVSALSGGTNRVNITNNSAAPGILVSGTHQIVGNIDGLGVAQVNAGSDLTVNHIVQSALVIGGTATSPGLVIIDASDASGNPLAGGFLLAGSLAPSGPFGEGVSSASMVDDSANPTVVSALSDSGLSTIAGLAAVPEPASLILLAVGGLGLGGWLMSRRRSHNAGRFRSLA